MSRFRRGLAVVLVTLLALALYAFWFEPSRIRVVEHTVTNTDGSKIFTEALRIAVIADLHAGAPFIGAAKIERVVTLTNAARPDLILLTGDYVIQGVVGGEHMAIERVAEKLRALSAPLGVYAVIGNHDRWESDTHITSVLAKAGIAVLENKSAEISRDTHTLRLVGLSDAFTTIPDIASALSDVPDDAQALCFTHSPDVFPDLPRSCALTIAGHTHGGQVWLPILGRPIVPSRFGELYAAGLVRENGKLLFVSTGIGTSIIPVRFGVVPEISLLNVE